ncbi:MAG TPA: hypothetical protein VMS98_01960 [Thermoanaerobaculia bacterium]|nr:hypothetical protein [Thermoanaerobaculia bacterium]
MTRRLVLFAALIAVATTASADRFSGLDRFHREIPIFIGGAFSLDNREASGDIDIIGTDEPRANITIVRTIRGLDDAAVTEGKQMTQPSFTGDDRHRIVRTWLSPMRSGRWSADFAYVVKVPRTVNVTVSSTTSNRIRVSDMRGTVRISNMNGGIVLERLSGAVLVESVNGNISFQAPAEVGNIQLTTINGTVEVHAPTEAAFRWVAEAVKGDIRTTFPIQGNFRGNTFSGYVKEPGRATILMRTLLGNVLLLRNGSTGAQAQSVKNVIQPTAPAAQQQPMRGLVARSLTEAVVNGNLQYATSMGDVTIGEVRGWAIIRTGAGSVEFGSVQGDLQVESNGGPLSLGNIFGQLTARTAAGDVVVESARRGGSIFTGGGIIRLLYSGGPMRLESGGGDIVVRRAAGPVSAETRSGDITITLDHASRSQRVGAKTLKGNLLLNVGAGFGADVEATILTNDANAHAIRSDFPGLTVRRDQVGGKTRIRATGRINGGGERVELSAENGGIQIASQLSATSVVNAPR